MPRLSISAGSATTITLDKKRVVAFAGCNYLGLAHHPRVVAALQRGAEEYGISTTASRETTGNTTVHDSLERALSDWLGQEDAVLLADGYTANIGVCQALARTHAVAIIDAKAHRSLRSAAVGAGMQVFEYEHRSPESAAWLCEQFGDQGVALLTDGVFAADGAVAPLPDLLRVLPRERGTLVVDDCHGLCVLGSGGEGTVAHFNLRDDRLVITTTLAKGLGCYGGAVLGSRGLVASVRRYADVYRRSTPVPTPIACAALEAVSVLRSNPDLLARLRENSHIMRQGLRGLGLRTSDAQVPIFTFMLQPAERMETLHDAILDAGYYAPLIEYPGGPGERFFRLSVTAVHTRAQIEGLIQAMRRHVAA
jgi:8-amino-7-oxononanoate synthase